jgi:hypothetical protein
MQNKRERAKKAYQKLKAAKKEKAHPVDELMIAVRKATLEVMEGRAPGARLEAFPGQFVSPENVKGALVVTIGIVPLRDEHQGIVIPKAGAPAARGGKIILPGGIS